MKLFGTAVIALLAVLFAILYPILILWSVNTIFALRIPYTIWTWIATVILSSVFQAQTALSSKKKR